MSWRSSARENSQGPRRRSRGLFGALASMATGLDPALHSFEQHHRAIHPGLSLVVLCALLDAKSCGVRSFGTMFCFLYKDLAIFCSCGEGGAINATLHCLECDAAFDCSYQSIG
jgi:hypothetical protein